VAAPCGRGGQRRSNKVFWRGLGLIAGLEPLDYFDGEPS
jgi:hypothetical protein